MDKRPANTPDARVFSRLRRSYLLALSLIGLALLTEHFIVESFLAKQAKDANIINVAGRQRMLSQRITKLSLLPPSAKNDTILNRDLANWQDRHQWLQQQLFDDPVLPNLLSLDETINQLKNETQKVAHTQDAKMVKEQVSLNQLSETFLKEMDAIVGQITDAATARVDRLRRTKIWLALATGGILLLELLFIFQPINRFVRRQFEQVSVEKKAQVEARQLAETAVQEKEHSLSELYALNNAIDQAAIFATLRNDGTIIHLSGKFARILDLPEKQASNENLVEYLHVDEGRQAYFSELIADTRSGNWQGEWQLETKDGNTHWLDISLVSARHSYGEIEVFLLANDITGRKNARQELDALNQQRLTEEIERGELRTRQIVEAQEKERLRVARDLHDGIGQKLTALKFSLESVRPDHPERLLDKVGLLKELSKELILGVRLATFNLTPPELIDYGLAAALEKMARELSRLTGERIVFVNKEYSTRLDHTREINLYRTVQEAVNNAIKYARANYILITLSAGDHLLSITIDDDGVGFERDEISERTDGSGMGLSFMEERIKTLGGRLFMISPPEGGTRITLNAPLPNTTKALPSDT
jgi:PAS domain S-box-containing protein